MLKKNLKKLGVFSAKQAYDFGYGKSALFRLVESGVLERVDRGFYYHVESNISPEDIDFAFACAKFGKNSTIGALSALSFYNLTNKVPSKIWVMVGTEVKSHSSRFRLLRTQSVFNIGVKQHKFFRITSIERTLVEALRYSTKVGLSTAISACRRALNSEMTTEKKILNMAEKLDFKQFVIRHWEAITGYYE